jgi:hypothetical protein
MDLGIQVPGMADWNPGIPFKNLFKQSRPWWVVDLDQMPDGSFDEVQVRIEDESIYDQLYEDWFDDKDYPTQIPFTSDRLTQENGQPIPLGLMTVMQAGSDAYPGGTYTLKFEGTGRIHLHGDTELDVQGNGGLTTVSFEITPNKGLWFDFLASDVNDPIQNIQILLPGFENDDLEADPFNPAFIDRLKGFSHFRFFESAHHPIFGPPAPPLITRWEERVRPDSLRYAIGGSGGDGWGDGWPLEFMIDLANRMDADVWWSSAYAVDDDYFTQAAKMFQERLNPNHRVYVEYSNEVWNGGYPQSDYATEQGLNLGLGENPDDERNARAAYTTKRSLDMFRLFREVFGNDADDRLVEVLSGWRAQPSYCRAMLTALIDPRVNPDDLQPDAFAIAPYLGLGDDDFADIANPSVDDVIDKAYAKLLSMNDDRYDNMLDLIALANEYELDMLTYESGQHFVSFDSDALVDTFAAANRDPRMYDIYLKYFGRFNALGFRAATQFHYMSGYGKFGSWGALERMDQPIETAPKFRALLTLLEQLPITPTNLTAELTATGAVQLSWNAVEGATEYTIYRHTVNDVLMAETVSTVEGSQTQWLDDSNPTEPTYYWLTANTANGTSTYSVGAAVHLAA